MGNFELVQSREKANPTSEEESKSARPLTVCLITALSAEDFIDPELTVKNSRSFLAGNVGVLTLASLLREKGYRPQVVNLDLLFLDFLTHDESCAAVVKDEAILSSADHEPLTSGSVSSSLFLPFLVEHLKTLSFDIFGFSSICSSYPLTLRLAEEVKRLHPESQIVLGGPQASVVDVPTMRAFSCVDFVVRGEAEQSFPTLLSFLSGGNTDVESIPGVTFRRGGAVIRNPNAPVIENLDDLPLPAFEIDPDLKNRGSVHLEIGRGCPFACKFCSTNDFFRRNFRLKSPQKMIEHMTSIKEEHGLSNFSLIHDMYTVDRKKVVAFCEALLECEHEFTWTCSARTDCIDNDLIDLMAQAGCCGIFFGIETGSARLQSEIKKNLNLEEARERIQCADRHGITTAVALITAFPDETRDDLRDTIHFYVDSLRFDHAEPQLSLLAPLAATPIHDEYRDQLVLDDIFSDMSHQGWQQDAADVELIRSHPDIFPNFYAVPTLWLDRAYVNELRDFVTYLPARFRWLPVALLQDSGDFLKVFDRWRTWIAERSPHDLASPRGVVPYYAHCQFRNDFLEFVETCYLVESATARAAIAAVLESERIPRAGTSSVAAVAAERTVVLNLTHFPFPVEKLLVKNVEADYQEIVKSLRTNEGLGNVRERKVTIVFRPGAESGVQVLQLTPLSAQLLQLCDGKRTVEQVIREFALLAPDIDGVPADKAGLAGLMMLREDELIDIFCCPVVEEETAEGVSESETALIPRYSSPPQMSNTQQPWPWPSSADTERAI
jgi:radical SAM superfamily enzyme YgiQ (UPF0313 family)